MGWPGSIQDNRVWSNSNVDLSKEKYFSNKESLLGDSAFSASMVMVPVFKKGLNSTLSEERKYFNTKLAKCGLRVNIVLGSSRRDFNVIKSSGRL